MPVIQSSQVLTCEDCITGQKINKKIYCWACLWYNPHSVNLWGLYHRHAQQCIFFFFWPSEILLESRTPDNLKPSVGGITTTLRQVKLMNCPTGASESNWVWASRTLKAHLCPAKICQIKLERVGQSILTAVWEGVLPACYIQNVVQTASWKLSQTQDRKLKRGVAELWEVNLLT